MRLNCVEAHAAGGDAARAAAAATDAVDACRAVLRRGSAPPDRAARAARKLEARAAQKLEALAAAPPPRGRAARNAVAAAVEVPEGAKLGPLRVGFLGFDGRPRWGTFGPRDVGRRVDRAALEDDAPRARPPPYAWRRVELRGGGGVTWRGDAESHVVLRAVVSEAERARLEAIILALKDRGALRPNPSGPRRFFARYDHDVLPSLGAADADGPADLEGADLFATAANLVERVTRRVERALGLDYRRGARDATLSRTLSVVEAGGFVHRHTDAYAAATGGERAAGDAPSAARDHLRCNIALRLAHCDSLRPVIDRRAVDVDDGDAWAFLASKREHETTVSEAAAPRVVLGFGWALAA